jgi:hypothetical protein
MGNNKTVPSRISLYYASQPYTEIEPKIEWHRMLFRFAQIREDAERIVNNWFDAYEVIEPALNLYFSTKTAAYKYLEGKFLALAQGLETYHRRTSKNLIKQCPEKNKDLLSGRLNYGNELSLRQRIKNIIDPFKKLIGTRQERDKLITTIVATRNYLTHYDKSLESKAVSGRDLWWLCLKMEAIFQLHLLQVLGFTQEEVQSVFDHSYELQQKLKKI